MMSYALYPERTNMSGGKLFVRFTSNCTNNPSFPPFFNLGVLFEPPYFRYYSIYRYICNFTYTYICIPIHMYIHIIVWRYILFWRNLK